MVGAPRTWSLEQRPMPTLWRLENRAFISRYTGCGIAPPITFGAFASEVSMSKLDFTATEFAERRSRLQAAMASAGLDWLVVVHPISIHWLTGSDAKSYQEFQCLMVGASGQPLSMLTRAGETHEFETDSLADEVIGWGGGTLEDPIVAFEALAQRLGICKARIGLEVPGFYLHPHHYVRLREWLGDALVAEPTDLISQLRLVRSAAELSYIHEATIYADL